MDFAIGLGLTPHATPAKYEVTTLHGATSIASEFTLTFRMKGTLRTAKFLGVKNLAKRYPGHRLHVPEKLLRKCGLKGDILYQDDSVINLLVGSNSSSLFPTILHQQDNVIIAQSKFTGKYLIQGAAKFLGFPNQYLAAQALQLNTLQFGSLQTPQNPDTECLGQAGGDERLCQDSNTSIGSTETPAPDTEVAEEHESPDDAAPHQLQGANSTHKPADEQASQDSLTGAPTRSQPPAPKR